MTWEPTAEEVAAYATGAYEAAEKAPAWDPGRTAQVVGGGLRAAYAKLEERLYNDAEILAPAALSQLFPPPVEYDEADNLKQANVLAEDGWRILHVYGPRDAPRYVLERERSSTSDGGG